MTMIHLVSLSSCMSKVCRDCGENKLMSEYYRHAMMADGHLNKCKNCVKGRVAQHREQNIAAIRAYDRERSDMPERVAMRKAVAERWKAGPELRKRTVALKREWGLKNPEKRAAHRAVSNAMKCGRLTREPCEICGEPVTQAHHDDYSKPLDVRWLCRKHHAEHHKALRRLGADPDDQPLNHKQQKDYP